MALRFSNNQKVLNEINILSRMEKNPQKSSHQEERLTSWAKKILKKARKENPSQRTALQEL